MPSVGGRRWLPKVQPLQVETHLRLATGNETPLVYRLMEDYYHEVKSPRHPKKHRWAVERLVDNPAVGRLWLVMVGADVVGYLVLSLGYSLEMGGLEAFLDDIYLIPQARGHGIGRSATHLALIQAAQLGARAVHVEVERRNQKVRNLYRHLGFTDGERARLMTCRLAPGDVIP